MNSKTRNIAIALIVLVSAGAMAYIWVSYGVKPTAKGAAAVQKIANSNSILLDGKIVADRNADLGFVMPAAINSISVKVGDSVKAGQVLATENSKDVKAQVAAAQAGAQSAQSMLDELNNSLKMQKLKLKGLDGNDRKIQKTQIASAEDSISAQKNAIVAANETVANAQAQLAKTALVAPFDGIITRQDAEIGEIGGPTVQPFLTIESAGPFQKIESYASDLDVAKLKIGDSANISFDNLGNEQVIAHITSIDPAAQNGGNATYKITLMLDEPKSGIRSGMHASISLAQ